ncbi:MAG: hypothetical protein VX923_05910 [Pseudomonadota bacterium]|nr:hypothetical protein [Pseudomonadota bacterium]
MAYRRLCFFLTGTMLFLNSCSFTEEALWPSLTGEDPAAEKTSTESSTESSASAPTVTNPTSAGTLSTSTPATTASSTVISKNTQPPLGNTIFQPTGVTPGTSTGTFVGKKIIDMRAELGRLQSSITTHNSQLQALRGKIVSNSQRYHGTIAAVNARLQVGTTPGNPVLVQQFNSSQADLDRIHSDITEMNELANRVSNSSTMSSYLSESTRASFAVSGAVDEDHRQLAILEDEVSRTDVLVTRLLKEVSNDVRRQTNYVATERANLNLVSAAIRTGEIFGGSLATKGLTSSIISQNVPATPSSTSGRRPLVVIRFDRNKVPFQQALYHAISRVLESRPSAIFDLVAVSPSSGGAARIALNSNKSRRHAQEVLQALTEMGLPPSRVAVSAKTMTNANTNEVHVYLR